MGPRLDAVATILAAVALSQRWRSGSEHAQTLATVFESRASALAHAPRFYDRATADAMFDEISQYAGLNFTSYLIEGARVRSPRRMMWCAEGVGEYRFSANHVPGLEAHAFTPMLRRIRRDVERAVGSPFNAVLINIYADGTEHAAWHSDDDPWLGKDFDVPSLSLGAARPFRTRRRGDGANETTVTLGHGSLLVMKGAFQRDYEHSLPRVAGAGVRINLTWRFIPTALRHLHNLKPRWDSDAPLWERLGNQRVPHNYLEDNRGRDR